MDAAKSQFLLSLVEYPEETAQAEYKSAIAFDSKSDFSAKLVKHILGQCNAGGGYIVVGFRENAQGKLAPDQALDEKISRSYETTRLCQTVDSNVSDGQRIQLHVHKVVFQEKTYPIISVEGFKESPLFCRKDVTGQDGKPILREGAVYIRDAAAKTVTVAGAEQFTVLLKVAVDRRQAEILQQVRALVDGSLAPTPSGIKDSKEGDESARAWFNSENAAAVSEMEKATPGASAYIQVTHYLLENRRTWSQGELVDASRKAECHNSGWPMGVVLNNPEAAPKPLKDGIRTIIYSEFVGKLLDYWSLQRDGKYFFLRTLVEDTIDRGKNRMFFDTRIWDCAEALVHCAGLYRELHVPQDTEVNISITHKGLAGRILGVAAPNRIIHFPRKCTEDEITWEKRLPLGMIEPELEPLVGEATGELFGLFDFWHPDESVWKGVLKEFLKSRV
jgi:hypothetical protein